RTLLSLLLLGCASAPPPQAPTFAPAPAVAAGPAAASFLADADAKLARFGARTSWPSEGDHDTWTANLAEAERLRAALDGADDDPPTRRALETRLTMLAAADTVFRFGDRMRERR